MIRVTTYVTLAVAALAAGTFAATGTAQDAPAPGTYQARGDHQQNRIASGVQSGQLSAGETRALEGREAKLNGQARADRAADGGKLTAADRTRLNHEQNHMSHAIHAEKHNATTAHYGHGAVGERRAAQQQRIATGVRDGRLTPREAGHLEHREQHINGQIHADRSAHGGKLTPGEKAHINHEQNRAGRAIYRDKHNGKVVR